MKRIVLIGWILGMMALMWFCWIRVLPEEVRASRAMQDIQDLMANDPPPQVQQVMDPWGVPYRRTTVDVNGTSVEFVMSSGANEKVDSFSSDFNDDVLPYDDPESWASRVYSLGYLRVIWWIGLGGSFFWIMTRIVTLIGVIRR